MRTTAVSHNEQGGITQADIDAAKQRVKQRIQERAAMTEQAKPIKTVQEYKAARAANPPPVEPPSKHDPFAVVPKQTKRKANSGMSPAFKLCLSTFALAVPAGLLLHQTPLAAIAVLIGSLLVTLWLSSLISTGVYSAMKQIESEKK